MIVLRCTSPRLNDTLLQIQRFEAFAKVSVVSESFTHTLSLTPLDFNASSLRAIEPKHFDGQNLLLGSLKAENRPLSFSETTIFRGCKH